MCEFPQNQGCIVSSFIALIAYLAGCMGGWIHVLCFLDFSEFPSCDFPLNTGYFMSELPKWNDSALY